MICIPYYINGKYQIARFSGSQNYIPTFTIENRGNGLQELFRFEKSPYAFDTAKGAGANGGKDYSLEIVRDGCQLIPEGSIIRLTLALKTKAYKSNCAINDIEGEGFTIKGGRLLLEIGNLVPAGTVATVIVEMVIVDEDSVKFDFRANVANRDCIWDIIIDFGSEASQIWTACRGRNDNQNRNNQVPLFKNILETYWKEESKKLGRTSQADQAAGSESDYYQYDAEDTNLYKSLFFLAGAIGKTISSDNLIRLNKVSDLMEMLQKNPARNDGMPRYIALPNLKLMHHGEVSLPTISVNGRTANLYQYLEQLRNEILKFFVKAAFDQLNRTINGKKTVCVTLLVPNTYSQTDLVRTRKEMAGRIEQILSDAGGDGDICPYSEVNTFSESDASFLGFFRGNRLNKLYPNKHYLIIDIGKGTTDFSVLKIKEDGRTALCTAKSGLIGAGNVMTFAALASVLKSWAETANSSEKKPATPEMIRNKIMQLVNTPDRAKKNDLYQWVEALKCNSVSGGQPFPDFISKYVTDNEIKRPDLSTLGIDGLITIIKSACEAGCSLSDDDAVMKGYADIVAGMIVKELQFVYHEFIQPIDYIIMTGRGAKCTPLYFAIVNKIKAYNPDLEVFTFTDIELKTACLRGPINNAVTLENTNVVGWPVVRKEGERTSVSNKALLDRWVGADKSLSREIGEQSAASILQGCKVTLNSPNDILSLGNSKYRVEFTTEQKDREIYMFFDGENFVPRSKAGSHVLTQLPGSERFTLLYETLFPVIESTGNVGEMQEHAFTELIPVLGGKRKTTNVPVIPLVKKKEAESKKTNILKSILKRK